jgi:hypothetical protein
MAGWHRTKGGNALLQRLQAILLAAKFDIDTILATGDLSAQKV